MTVEMARFDYDHFVAYWVGDPELPADRRIFVRWEIPRMQDALDVLDLEWTLNQLFLVPR